jgi:hypothetical protein
LRKAGYAGDYVHPLSFAISAFGGETAARTRNSLWARLWDWIVGDGPDYRYALICPRCRKHNGMADASCMPVVKYRCVGCQSFVSATDVLSETAQVPAAERPQRADIAQNLAALDDPDSDGAEED